jgi:hypothetical protein
MEPPEDPETIKKRRRIAAECTTQLHDTPQTEQPELIGSRRVDVDTYFMLGIETGR